MPLPVGVGEGVGGGVGARVVGGGVGSPNLDGGKVGSSDGVPVGDGVGEGDGGQMSSGPNLSKHFSISSSCSGVKSKSQSSQSPSNSCLPYPNASETISSLFKSDSSSSS